MPQNTNGVYQQVSSPSPQNCGVGTGVSYPVNGKVAMGKSQYSPGKTAAAGRVPTSHDGRGNSSYK